MMSNTNGVLVRMLRLIGLLLVLFPLWSTAAEIDKTNPYTMIQNVSQTMFARLKAEQVQIQRDPEVLRIIVKEELLPYINTRYAAYKVLGTQLKKTSKQERNEFVAAFTDYLVASYAQVMTQYTDQNVAVEPSKAIPTGRSIVGVRVDITDNKRPPIRLDFKLRKNKKTNEWQGFDMVVEGVSLISTKQSEWSGQLRNKGIASVSASLRNLAAKPIRIEDQASE